MNADRPPAALLRLGEEIERVRREIDRLGVLLATRRISPDGYAHVVKGLKAKRALLETSRMRLELDELS